MGPRLEHGRLQMGLEVDNKAVVELYIIVFYSNS